jgi:hypothetical protein
MEESQNLEKDRRNGDFQVSMDMYKPKRPKYTTIYDATVVLYYIRRYKPPTHSR